MDEPEQRTPLTEEEAVFSLGKRLSELHHEGDDLPADKVLVGSSWVEPRELMEEYEKHFPPVGPRRTKQVTDRVFSYRLYDEPYRNWDYRGELLGIEMSCDDAAYSVLHRAELFRLGENERLRRSITTSTDNRYDIVEGEQATFAIDKLRDHLSVLRLRFRFKGPGYSTFQEEVPVWGDRMTSMTFPGDFGPTTRTALFPFLPFDEFWSEIDRYLDRRRAQIGEMISDPSAGRIHLD